MAEICFDIETTGLLNKVNDCRITCIGLYHSDLGIRIFSSKDEKKMLMDFTEFVLADVEFGSTWVSFNGIGFDVPFICERATKLGVDLPDGFFTSAPGKKPNWFLTNHVDLMLVVYPHFAELVRATSTGRMTKDSVRNWFNIYEPRAGSAQHCLLVAQGDDWSPIFMHNSLDLFTTKEIYDECVKREWC